MPHGTWQRLCSTWVSHSAGSIALDPASLHAAGCRVPDLPSSAGAELTTRYIGAVSVACPKAGEQMEALGPISAVLNRTNTTSPPGSPRPPSSELPPGSSSPPPSPPPLPSRIFTGGFPAPPAPSPPPPPPPTALNPASLVSAIVHARRAAAAAASSAVGLGLDPGLVPVVAVRVYSSIYLVSAAVAFPPAAIIAWLRSWNLSTLRPHLVAELLAPRLPRTLCMCIMRLSCQDTRLRAL
jgi:hypothetical protein